MCCCFLKKHTSNNNEVGKVASSIQSTTQSTRKAPWNVANMPQGMFVQTRKDLSILDMGLGGRASFRADKWSMKWKHGCQILLLGTYATFQQKKKNAHSCLYV